jgi:hypothetical protein
MKRAAIGVRTHSGWGALVAVSFESGVVEVIDRRRIAITARMAGAKQPYHHAERLGIQKAERFLADCFAATEKLASAALQQVIAELNVRDYCTGGCAVVLAAGRPLPVLSKVLASHALIHAAEGEFFRDVVRRACAGLGVSVVGLRERDLEQSARTAFGSGAPRIRRRIDTLGRSLGPPWTQDQKAAALAALVALAS